MIRNDKNVGGMYLDNEGTDPRLTDPKYTIRTIEMNDLADQLPLIYMFKRPLGIMKIDIEGYETRAFQEADVLFDRVDFCFIFMEWALVQRNSSASQINAMFHFMHTRDFEAYAGEKLENDNWKKWPWDIVWVKKGYESVYESSVSLSFFDSFGNNL